MVTTLLRARRVDGALTSAATRHDAPGARLQIRRGPPADLGPVHRQVDRRGEQGHGGAGGGRAATQDEGARRGGRAAEAHPPGERQGQESLSPSARDVFPIAHYALPTEMLASSRDAADSRTSRGGEVSPSRPYQHTCIP